MITIKILTGSIRPGRFNVQPVNWIFEIAQKRSDISVELIDLEKLNLPFLDEPIPPLQHKYSKEHTIAWSKVIDTADGFIFVTPEYNHSISPVLKNAVDYLNHEWNFKPITFVSYGSQAGGARSVEHWRGVAGELKMYDLREQVLLPNYWERMDEQGRYKFSEEEVSIANHMLDSLIFWTEIMKDAREKMQKRK